VFAFTAHTVPATDSLVALIGPHVSFTWFLSILKFGMWSSCMGRETHLIQHLDVKTWHAGHSPVNHRRYSYAVLSYNFKQIQTKIQLVIYFTCSGKPEGEGGWGHYQNKGLLCTRWSKPDFGNAIILGLYGVWKWMQKLNRCFMFYCKVCHEIRTHTCEAEEILCVITCPSHTMKFLGGFFIHEKSQSLHQLSKKSLSLWIGIGNFFI
jgi:hypothetical protein